MRDGQEIPNILSEHYQKTIENLALVSGENLHFVGYFEDPNDTLQTALHNLNHLFAERACLTATDRVLDVGCGTGGPACYLAETVGCRIVGIDIGDPQLTRARQLAEAKGVAHLVTFYKQNATEMTLDARQFDAVLLTGVASNVAHKEKLFAECARVTKENGRLILADLTMIHPAWFKDPKNAVQSKVWNTFFANPLLESVEGYCKLFQSHGFRILEVEDLARHMVRSFALWPITLQENQSQFSKQMGESRFRALLKGTRVISEVARDGHVGCAVITAIRQVARTAPEDGR